MPTAICLLKGNQAQPVESLFRERFDAFKIRSVHAEERALSGPFMSMCSFLSV